MAVYKLIREDIVEDILTGIYEPVEMIKGQEIYAKKFNVSRATVRKAIDELVEKKVLFTVKGKGTFVSEQTTSKTRSGRKLSFSDSERVKTQKLSSKIIALFECKANKRIARQLGIELGICSDEPVLFIRRTTYSQQGRVMEYCEDYECSDIKGLKIRTFA